MTHTHVASQSKKKLQNRSIGETFLEFLQFASAKLSKKTTGPSRQIQKNLEHAEFARFSLSSWFSPYALLGVQNNILNTEPTPLDTALAHPIDQDDNLTAVREMYQQMGFKQQKMIEQIGFGKKKNWDLSQHESGTVIDIGWGSTLW